MIIDNIQNLFSDHNFLDLYRTVPNLVLNNPSVINIFVQIIYTEHNVKLRAVYLEILADTYDNLCKYGHLQGLPIRGIGFKYSYPELTQREMYFRPVYITDMQRFIPLSKIPDHKNYIAFSINHQGTVLEAYINSGPMSEYRVDLTTGAVTDYYHVSQHELQGFDNTLQQIIADVKEYIDKEYKIIIARKDDYTSLYVYLESHNEIRGSVRDNKHIIESVS